MRRPRIGQETLHDMDMDTLCRLFSLAPFACCLYSVTGIYVVYLGAFKEQYLISVITTYTRLTNGRLINRILVANGKFNLENLLQISLFEPKIGCRYEILEVCYRAL